LTASRPGIEGGLEFYATLGALWNIQKRVAKKPTNNISDKSTVSSKQIKVFWSSKRYGINPKSEGDIGFERHPPI
jgi:hypothetical protein